MAGSMEILYPRFERQREAGEMHPFPAQLEGKVIGFLDNGKPNADVLLGGIEEVLTQRYRFGQVVHEQKRNNGGALPDMLERLAHCDLVINALGD